MLIVIVQWRYRLNFYFRLKINIFREEKRQGNKAIQPLLQTAVMQHLYLVIV